MKATATLEREPVEAERVEAPALERLNRALRQMSAEQAVLIGPNGERLPVPHSAYELLRRIVGELATGVAVAVVPYDAQLTTQQAAEFLNVSRPFLITLLDDEKIRYRRVGKHRRIAFRDLLEYRRTEDQRRGVILDEIVRDAEDAGLYDRPDPTMKEETEAT